MSASDQRKMLERATEKAVALIELLQRDREALAAAGDLETGEARCAEVIDAARLTLDNLNRVLQACRE